MKAKRLFFSMFLALGFLFLPASSFAGRVGGGGGFHGGRFHGGFRGGGFWWGGGWWGGGWGYPYCWWGWGYPYPYRGYCDGFFPANRPPGHPSSQRNEEPETFGLGLSLLAFLIG